jgi:cytosine/adenosine deaminase-related metal-dependent hydrolase/ubiquinone/menaquinone biosynthesis C-methylase UbiE
VTSESDVLADDGERALSSPEAYGFIAQHYDEQLNPLLALEERMIAPLLPSVAGKCVLDVGCGTGRWLARLAECGPRVMWGVDASPEMLAVAAAKLGDAAVLSFAQGTDLPIATGAADVVICSFVASYIEDMTAFARELRRVCSQRATVLLTDLHPRTTRTLGWKRAFRSGAQEVVLKTCPHSREELVDTFREEGFAVELEVEPEFGEQERPIFKAAGKTKEFERARGEPALLVLGFKPGACITASGPANTLRISGARIALDACTSVGAAVEVRDGRIQSIRTSDRSDMRADHVLNLSGYLVLPGLINAHDHLEFALFPRLGNRTYANAHEWALDIYQPKEEPIRSLRKIDKSIRLWWGGVRNLLSGVTTVCHHNEYAPLFDDDFPVRVLRQYRWAHSLAFEEDMQARAEGRSSEAPFFVHLGEGTDVNAEAELWEMDRRGLLNSRTVLVHGLAIRQKGLKLVRSRGASIVWCPSSNQFLFERTLDPQFIDACPLMAIGSDSPLTSAGDLLDEIRTAQNCGVSAAKIYDLVTTSSARVLGLSGGEGVIRPGATADLLAIPDRGLSPAEALANATYRDIELVISGGEIKLVSETMKSRLDESQLRHLSAIRVEDNVRWIAAPVDELLAAAESVLGPDIRLGGKRVGRA